MHHMKHRRVFYINYIRSPGNTKLWIQLKYACGLSQPTPEFWVSVQVSNHNVLIYFLEWFIDMNQTQDIVFVTLQVRLQSRTEHWTGPWDRIVIQMISQNTCEYGILCHWSEPGAIHHKKTKANIITLNQCQEGCVEKWRSLRPLKHNYEVGFVHSIYRSGNKTQLLIIRIYTLHSTQTFGMQLVFSINKV